ncbi:uncharacterized protein MELLADRAFT_114205 [Melampsora larici-populina 98AG31]|uniref:Uncharacterized protein n=1 Tax=Melampsora larici-populina (strain 98AG31 / pathotype 3-4-7) TaxID=747676 RepID=F4SCL5_MELLP|nr:uncharacterized protein MELLADRAFT_114205 [Melampsora larici-populina 98AG31]EGF97614.1 hypothetical protein MELLADRAFT_114205 [Melampsora larici-populina 98AG31]
MLIQLCLDLVESFQIIGGDMKDPKLTSPVAAFVIGKGDADGSQSGNDNDDVLNRAYLWVGAKGFGLLPRNRLFTIWTTFETIFFKHSLKPLLIAMIDLSLSRLALNYSERFLLALKTGLIPEKTNKDLFTELKELLKPEIVAPTRDLQLILRKPDYESCLIEFWKTFTKECTPNNPIVFEWPYPLLNLHSKWLRKSLNQTACGFLEDHLKKATELFPETCFPWQEQPVTIKLLMKGEDQTIIESLMTAFPTLSHLCTNFHIGQSETMTHYGL